MYDVKIVATGSSGNCIIIDDVLMIDTGVTKQIFNEYSQNIKHLILTHRHGDHTNISILNYLAKTRPYLLSNGLWTNLDVFEFLRIKAPNVYAKGFSTDRIISSEFDEILSIDDKVYRIQAFELSHDVENYGMLITNQDGDTLLFATDTRHMNNAPDGKFDYILLEGNYDENVLIENLQHVDANIRFRASRNLRHYSMQAFEDYVRNHSKENTIVFQLHESSEYGLTSPLGIQYTPLNRM